MEYTELEDGTIQRTNEDGSVSYIPKDETNSDYQAYLNKDNPDWGNGEFTSMPKSVYDEQQAALAEK